MTVTGIIAEFNPFHNGHKYLLKQAEGLKIVAMSGNFVQRGEPAIVDKWIRAQMALEMERTWWSSSPFSWLFSRLIICQGSGRNLVPSRNRPIDFWDRSGLRLPSDCDCLFGERGGNGSFLAKPSG